MGNHKALVTLREAAAELELTVWQAHYLVTTGRLKPAQQLPGRTGAYLFERSAVEAMKRAKAGAR